MHKTELFMNNYTKNADNINLITIFFVYFKKTVVANKKIKINAIQYLNILITLLFIYTSLYHFIIEYRKCNQYRINLKVANIVL